MNDEPPLDPDLPDEADAGVDGTGVEWHAGGLAAGHDERPGDDHPWVAPRPWVSVVAVVDDGVVLVEAHDRDARTTLVRLPRGRLAPGRTVPAAARRGLQSAVGIEAEAVRTLASDWRAGVRGKRRVVVADVPDGAVPEPAEDRSVVTVPPDEAVDRVRRWPTDEATVTGLLLADREGDLRSGD